MSKVLRAAFFSVALLLLCGNLYAEGSLFGHGTEDETLFTVVNGSSGVVSGISSSSRIFGYSITGTANAVAGFYDNGTFFAEGGCLANDMRTIWFPMPKDMTGSLWVQVNASTTIVTIYYE